MHRLISLYWIVMFVGGSAISQLVGVVRTIVVRGRNYLLCIVPQKVVLEGLDSSLSCIHSVLMRFYELNFCVVCLHKLFYVLGAFVVYNM